MASDLSFNIVALDRASATFIKMGEEIDRLASRLERLDGKDVDVDVNVKTDESRKALDSFDTRFKLIAAGIVAASPALGAAIVGGIGAGFIGVAALAQKSNKEVQETYSTLWHNVVTSTQNATDQLVPQIVGAGKSIDSEMQRLGPSMKVAFSAAGPDIVALTRGVNEFAHEAIPGASSAMQNSLPVFEGAADLMSDLGGAFGDSVSSMGQHASEYGAVLTSVGNITRSVVTTVTTIVNTLASAWAQNASQISGAVEGTGKVISGLATGVLPVLVVGLNTAATAVKVITGVLGPMAPILGGATAAALLLWGAFKVSDLITSGIKNLAMGVITLGGNMEAAALKGAGMVASMQGVSVQSSTAANVVKSAGSAAASASLGFASVASTIAGPLSIAIVAGTLLFGLFSSGEDKAAQRAANVKSSIDSMTSAFESSSGAVSKGVLDALQASPAYKTVADSAKALGVSQTELTEAIVQGGPALDDIKRKFQIASGSAKDSARSFDDVVRATKADINLKGLNDLIGAFAKAKTNAGQMTAAQEQVGRDLLKNADYQQTAASTATLLGLSLDRVKTGFIGVAGSGLAASHSVSDVSTAFVKSQLSITQAQQGIKDQFTQADKAVVQAQASVRDASHSYEQSIRGVTDAQHSYVQAHKAVAEADQGVVDAQHNVESANLALKDAYAGVTAAQETYAKSQEQERRAEVALHEARQQAVQDLKDLHLQLQDQVVSEQSARVRLFDARKDAAKLGVTDLNASDVAGSTVTDENEKQIKAAIDLISAQNSLNNSLNSGAKLRKDVSAADVAGVDGARSVISAQESLRNAQDQVRSSAQGVVKAHQAVSDAAYSLQQASKNLTKSKEAVTEAAYNEQRAHQAVRDAQYQQQRAADQLKQAKYSLRDAVDASSRSLDLNTKAGQNNLTKLMGLWDAIRTSGMPVEDQYRTMIDSTATSLGISKDKAQDYLTKLGLIPKDFKYGVTAVAQVDTASYQSFFDSLIGTSPSPMISSGIGSLLGLPQKKDGGPIDGVGGPRDDMNLIWASPNEFMQPADSVDYYGVGFMEAVRAKRLPRGGDGAALPGFADGGLIAGTTMKLGALGANYMANVNALDIMGFPHPPKLPEYVPPAYVTHGGFMPGGGVNQWIPEVIQALHMLNLPEGILGKVLRRMNQESGGNPNIANNWDSNAAKGTPSIGLMQTIQPTFNAYAGPLRNLGITNPLANIYAGLNYAGSRYGRSHGGFLGGVVYAMDKPGGYDKGGWLQPGSSGVNGLNKPEAVLTPEESAAFVSFVKSGGGGGETHYHYSLTVYNAANQEINLKAQFKRLEIESGVL